MKRGSSDIEVQQASHARWSEDELAALEAAHAEGLSTQQVVELFGRKGEPLSEATFRKYVQLGLLPRSVRVGRKGKHRGSQGLYPATIVRQIQLVRRLMAQGHTIQDIQREFLFVGRRDRRARRASSTWCFEAVERSAERGARAQRRSHRARGAARHARWRTSSSRAAARHRTTFVHAGAHGEGGRVAGVLHGGARRGRATTDDRATGELGSGSGRGRIERERRER